MRLALCSLAALAAALPLQAQWTTTAVYNGTLNTDIPVGVAIRAFGPTHDVVLVVERQNGRNGPGTKHFLKTLRYDCLTATCGVGDVSAYPPLDVPPANLATPDGLTNQYYNASLALRDSPVGTLASAHIVRRTGPTAQCGNRQLNLGEERLTFGLLAWTHFDISNNIVGNCQDRQLSYTEEWDDVLYTCWTMDPTFVSNDNQVWCGSRNLTANAWSGSLLADGLDDQDHMAFVVDPGTDWRYILHRDRDQSPDSVSLRVPELGTSGPLVATGNAADEFDYPSIARAPDNSYHAVWHIAKPGVDEIRYATCPNANDCTLAANWLPSVLLRAANGASHAEIAISSDGRMMVIWMEPDGSGDRVHFQEKCPKGPWLVAAGEVPRPAVGQQVSQSTFMGRPHLSIDDDFNVVHLAFVEFDNPGNPGDGDVYWAHKTFATCPP